jgi:hypothetical protein
MSFSIAAACKCGWRLALRMGATRMRYFSACFKTRPKEASVSAVWKSL